MTKSLNTKLLSIVIGGFTIMVVGVLFLANLQTRQIIDDNQVALRAEQVNQIVRTVDSKHKMLEDKGLLAALGKRSQEKLLDEFAEQCYAGRDAFGATAETEEEAVAPEELLVYPLIIDHEGRVLLHPTIERGSDSLMEEDFTKLILEQGSGQVDYVFGGKNKWMYFQEFDGGPDWNWHVAYAVPHSIKYADADALWGNLASVMLSIAFVLVGVLAFCLKRMITGPLVAGIHSLSQLARSGDISIEVQPKLLKRKDEIGELSLAIEEIIVAERAVVEATTKIAGGNWDLDVPLRSDADLLNRSINSMTREVNAVLTNVRDVAREILDGANQMSDTSQSLSSSAGQSASLIENIRNSMEEISTQTGSNAENAKNANTLSTEGREEARHGESKMQEMIKAMDEITSSSKEIATSIGFIDDIAFQTNLLALNAAVEAARAGQHGKGFAVVAEEVRNLATRSSKAAAQTAELINQSQGKVNTGTQIAQEMADALAVIVQGADSTNDVVGRIAEATNEQAQEVTQVNGGLLQVSEATQGNSEHAEETATVAEQMTRQAETLRGLVGRFTLKANLSERPTVGHRQTFDTIAPIETHEVDSDVLCLN